MAGERRFDAIEKPRVEPMQGYEYDFSAPTPPLVQISVTEGYENPVEESEMPTFVPKILIEKGDN